MLQFGILKKTLPTPLGKVWFLSKTSQLCREENQVMKVLLNLVCTHMGYSNRIYILSKVSLWNKIAKLNTNKKHWRLAWKYTDQGTRTRNRSPFEPPFPLPNCFIYMWDLIIIRQGSVTLKYRSHKLRILRVIGKTTKGEYLPRGGHYGLIV